MLRRSRKVGIVCALVWAVAGCSTHNPLLEKETYSNLFSNTPKLFDASDFSLPELTKDTVSLGPSGPVAPENLVTADGRCAAPTAQTTEPETRPVAAAPADRPVGSLAGDLAGAPMAAAPAGTQVSAPPPDRLQPEGLTGGAPVPQVLGGVGLGMSECQVVRRAGPPSSVAISAEGKGERKVVLTYAGGSWPGVYHFTAGRLKVIEGLPAQTQAARPKSTRPPAASRPVRQSAGHVYVQ